MDEIQTYILYINTRVSKLKQKFPHDFPDC